MIKSWLSTDDMVALLIFISSFPLKLQHNNAIRATFVNSCTLIPRYAYDRFSTTGWVDGSTGTLPSTPSEDQPTSIIIWTLPLLSTRQPMNSTNSPYSMHSPICPNSCLPDQNASSWHLLLTAASTKWLSSDPTQLWQLCFLTGELLLSCKWSKASNGSEAYWVTIPNLTPKSIFVDTCLQPAQIFRGAAMWTEGPPSVNIVAGARSWSVTSV